MEQTAATLDFDLPADLAEEFGRCARDEQTTESELFQRMFRYYVAARDEQRLEGAILERLASRSRTLDPLEWRALKERMLALLAE